MKLYVLFLCVLFTYTTKASNYYLSVINGNDSRTSLEAKNQATPWKTIDKINCASLLPGDSVFFNKGEIFYGTLLVNNSGAIDNFIYYGAYGTGTNPIISGLTALSGWTLLSGNIYYTSLDVPTLNVVTVNNIVKGMGRYPNNDYLTYESHNGNTSITDNQLPATPNWVGGEVVIRKYRWIIDRHTIIDQSGTILSYNALRNYGNNTGYNPVDNNGYFIQNNIKTLDQFGEWYYDSVAKRLYMDFSGSVPENNIVKASTKDKNLNFNTKSNLTFNSIDFEGGNTAGIYMANCQNVIVSNCNFSNEGGVAIYGGTLSKILIQNCSINNSLSNGVYFEYDANYCTLDNVSVLNTNIIAGSGRSGDGVGNGIEVIGNNTIIKKCKVINTGYNGIQFGGDSVLIENNLIDSFCTIKDDGGGIYTYTGDGTQKSSLNQKIIGNIILNGKGAAKGTDDTLNAYVHGIYLDNNSSNIDLLNNTVAHCAESGIFLHDGHNLKIANNTLFDNTIGLQLNQDVTDSNSFIRNNTFKNNIFFAKNDLQMTSVLKSLYNDINLFGNFDSNFYCRPLSDKSIISTAYTNQGFTSSLGLNLNDWQSTYSQDIASKASPYQFPAYTINSLVGSNLFANGAFNTNITGVNKWSATNNCQPIWVSDKLDTGSLQISFTQPVVTNRSAIITISVGTLQSDKNYLLNFSLLGSKLNRSVTIYLRDDNDPFKDISIRKYCKLTTKRTENELLFRLPYITTNASIILEINESDSTLWIDNLKFQEADITLTDPDEYIRFEYNATNIAKTITLNQNYIDLYGVNYSGNVTLQPFSSIMLIKSNIQTLSLGFSYFTAEPIEPKVMLNWGSQFNSNTKSYEIQRADNGTVFKVLNTILPNINSTYTYIDNTPLQGKNYYRIKEFTKDGKFSFTKIILIDRGVIASLSLYPNPTSGSMYVTFTIPKSIYKTQLDIKSIQGVILKSFPLTTLSETRLINTNFLNSGIYVLTLYAQNININKQFIKL